MGKTKRAASIVLLAVCIVWPTWAAPSSAKAEEQVGGQTVSILYFNDGHEIVPVTDKLGTRGGVARIKTLVDSVGGDKIVAFGGDLGGGTLFGGVFKGVPMVDAFNRIPVDLANFGQHDFDAGVSNTLELVKASRFQWITSNLTGSDGEPFGRLPQYAVVEKQGIRIGFLGLTSAMETTTKDDGVKQQPVIDSAKKAVALLKQANVDLIVALTQEPIADDKALLAAVPEIQVVFTEEEAEEKSFVYEVDGGKRFVFSPQGNMGSIIHLGIGKNQDGSVVLSHQILKVDETVAEDAPLASLAADYQQKLENELSKEVAVLAGDMPYGDNHESRFKETAIGNWIADAYRDYYRTDIAFANGGGIRASAKKGSFTLKDAKSILPFGNKIVVAEATGEMVLAALENSAAGVDKLAGGFLQISGLTYTYDADKPVGQRITEATIGTRPIQKDAVYKLALSNFMYTGGDNYTMFANAKTIVGANEALTDFELLAAYTAKTKTAGTVTDGRIAVKGFADVPAQHWAYTAIKEVTGRSVMSGLDEGRFGVNASVTREDVQAASAKLVPNASDDLIWEQIGIDGADLKALVLREELALAVQWLYEKKSGRTLPVAAKSQFDDEGQISGDKMKSAVASLAGIGLLEGRQPNVFGPKEKATRAELALLLWKLK